MPDGFRTQYAVCWVGSSISTSKASLRFLPSFVKSRCPLAKSFNVEFTIFCHNLANSLNLHVVAIFSRHESIDPCLRRNHRPATASIFCDAGKSATATPMSRRCGASAWRILAAASGLAFPRSKRSCTSCRSSWSRMRSFRPWMISIPAVCGKNLVASPFKPTRLSLEESCVPNRRTI